MSLTSSALSAFQTASGMSSESISLFIRTFLLIIVFLWAAYVVYGMIHYFKYHDVEIDLFFQRTFRVLFVVALMVALVYI